MKKLNQKRLKRHQAIILKGVEKIFPKMMFSFQELINAIEAIEHAIEHLELLLTEPEAITSEERYEIGGIIAKYKWLPKEMTIGEILVLKVEFENRVIKFCNK